MAVHSFASIQEIVDAPDEEERKVIRSKVLAESRSFDTHLRQAVTKKNAKERREALLNLEGLYEFRRSHPTVEVCAFMIYKGALSLIWEYSTSRPFWSLLGRPEMQRCFR